MSATKNKELWWKGEYEIVDEKKYLTIKPDWK